MGTLVQAPLKDFTAEMFEPLVGETLEFVPEGPGERARLKLLEVKRGQKAPMSEKDPFSLLFSLKDQPPLSPCLYGLSHPNFVPDGLLISRVKVPKHERVDPEAAFYEAVFS